MALPWQADPARPVGAQATFALCAVLSIVTIATSSLTQSPLLTEGGLGWDGAQYAQLTAQCWRQPLQALEPFVYRIGVPCLAALVPAPPPTALFIVNVASATLFLFLLAVWLRRLVDPSVVPWLLAVFAFHWLGPLRYTFWYPTYVDPLAMCAIVGALLLRDRPFGLVTVCVAGALVRETVVIVPASLMIGRLMTLTAWGRSLDWRKIANDRAAAIGLAATTSSLVAIATAHAVVTPASDYWMADSALYWAYTKALPTYLLAWCITYGPMLVLPMVCWRPVRTFVTAAPEYAVMVIAFGALAWIGGSDTERFLLWAAPMVLVMIGIAAAEIDWRRSRGALWLLVAGQVVNGRWFLLTPTAVEHGQRAWPLLTPFNAQAAQDLLSQTPSRPMSMLALIQYLALAGILALWLRRRPA